MNVANTQGREAVLASGATGGRGDRVEAVERALAVMQRFHEPGEGLSLAVLAQRTALYTSTLLRISASLVRKGFLHRDAKGLFWLGPELQRLGALSCPPVDDKELIRAALARLVAATQETASFYVRHGDHRVCLLRHNSPRSARGEDRGGADGFARRGGAAAVAPGGAGRREVSLRRRRDRRLRGQQERFGSHVDRTIAFTAAIRRGDDGTAVPAAKSRR